MSGVNDKADSVEAVVMRRGPRIVSHQLDEELAIRLLGWKWMSFIGIPVKGTSGYPAKCRVRQLFSAAQLKAKSWREFFEEWEGCEATGDEPLAYGYCSSQSSCVPLPRFTIMVEERR